MSGYYRHFIKNYIPLAKPSTNFLKKDNFYCISTATEAFVKFKTTVTTTPVLIPPDFSQPFTLETNASSVAIGIVLNQNKHTIDYFS